MDTNVNENPTGGFEYGLLAEIVHEFNLARRNVSSYPKGHPVVSRSCERVADLFDRLFSSRGEITFGVARETLLFGEVSLDRFTPVARGVARILFHHGIVLVTFMKGLTPREIEEFSGILRLKRSSIADEGGIEKLMREAGIEHLRVRKICYDAFRASDDLFESGQLEAVAPWDAFVQRFLTATRETPDGVFPVGPMELAEYTGTRYPVTPGLMEACLESAVQECSGSETLSEAELEYLRKLGEFVAGLDGEPRRSFLEGLFVFAGEREGRALNILAHLPRALYPEIRDYTQCGQVTLSPLALEVVERMMKLSGPDRRTPDGAEDGSSGSDGTDDRKMEVLFREEADGEFTPRDYLDTLKELVQSGNLPKPDSHDLAGLQDTLSSDRIESSVSAIILASIGLASPERAETLTRSLIELGRYFLETGNFRALENMYNRLGAFRADSGNAATLADDVIRFLESDEFAAEVLGGLDIWGKDKYHDIGSLIQRIGVPFVEPLLDRLADEQNRTLRRYFLDQVMKLGGRATDAVLARLGDQRWYVVRNLVIILRHTGDPEVLVHLARLARFPHPKVRRSVLETYLSFRDPAGDRLILQDLSGDDGDARLRAIQYADKSRDPRVHEALLGILRRKGLSLEQFEEKKAALHALAKAGRSETVPLLEKMLAARHFLRRALWNMLKKEMVLSLGNYGIPSAEALLVKTAKTSNRELSRVAAEVLAARGERNG